MDITPEAQEEAEHRLQAAVREYVRTYANGLAADWLLVMQYIPAEGEGDGYLLTGREGLPQHAAQGLIRTAEDNLPQLYGFDDDWCPFCEDDCEEIDPSGL